MITLEELRKDPTLVAALSHAELVALYLDVASLAARMRAQLSVAPAADPPVAHVPDTMTAEELAGELKHTPDWVYRQAKKPGSLVSACRLVGDGQPRFSRRLLERARRARMVR